MKLLDTKKTEKLVTFVVELDSSVWKKELAKVTNKLVKNVNMPGFRKGKVPFKIAEKQVKSQSYQTTLNNLLPSTISELESANAKANLPVLVDEPFISITNVSDENAIFEINYDVMPNVELGDWDKLELDYSQFHQFQPSEVDSEIERLLKSRKKLVDVKRDILSNDDVAIIDFVGRIDGKEFAGGSAQEFSLKIGSKSFIDNFEDQMLGMKVGEKRTINVKFPDDYHSKLHAGKSAEFDVTLNKIQSETDYKLDDDFVLSLKIPDVFTVEQLKDKLETHFKQRDMVNFKSIVKNDFAKKFANIVNLSFIPSNTLAKECDYIRGVLEKQATDNKTTISKQMKETGFTNESLNESINNDAVNSIKYVFGLDKIAELNHIEFTDQDYDEYLKQISTLYGVSYSDIKKRMEKDELYIREQLLNERIIDFVLQKNIDNYLESKK